MMVNNVLKEYIVNILCVNSILEHTDIVTSSHIKGEMKPVIYNFSQYVPTR